MSTQYNSQTTPFFCVQVFFLLIILSNPCTSAPLSVSVPSVRYSYTNSPTQNLPDSPNLSPKTTSPPISVFPPQFSFQAAQPHRQLNSVPDDSLSLARNVSASDNSDQVIKNYRPEESHKKPKFGRLEPSIPKTIRPVLTNDDNRQSRQSDSDNKAPTRENRNDKLSRMSIFAVIHPALAAALTPDRTHPIKLPAKGPLSKIEYRSAPLKGTETRDRLSLGLYTGASLTPLKPTMERGPQHTLSTDSTLGLNQSYPPTQIHQSPFTSTSQHGSPSATKSFNQLNPTKFHARSGGHSPRAQSPYSPIRSRDNAYSESKPEDTPQPQKPLQHSSSSGPQLDIEPIAALKSLTTSLWTTVVENFKRTINTVKPSKDKQPISPVQTATSNKEGTELGYTEEELNALIDDMMREIQSRSDDAQAHQEMLRKNNRWSVNDDTGGGPLVNMRTQVLVDPEVVAQALAISARKLILSKHPRPSREATLELLRAAQVKLVEVLRPVVK